MPVGELHEGNLGRAVGAIVQPEAEIHDALALVEELAQLVFGGRLRNVAHVNEKPTAAAAAAALRIACNKEAINKSKKTIKLVEHLLKIMYLPPIVGLASRIYSFM